MKSFLRDLFSFLSYNWRAMRRDNWEAVEECCDQRKPAMALLAWAVLNTLTVLLVVPISLVDARNARDRIEF